jgi:hypothetical protein
MLNLLGLKVKQIPDELKRIQVIEKPKNEYYDDIIKRRSTGRNVYIADESKQNEFVVLPDPRNMDLEYIDLDIGVKLNPLTMLTAKIWDKIYERITRFDFMDVDTVSLENNSYSKFAANCNGTEIYILYGRKYLLLCNFPSKILTLIFRYPIIPA